MTTRENTYKSLDV
jgi:hypothetical protein